MTIDDDLFARLTAEVRFQAKQLADADRELSREERVQGLPTAAGVRRLVELVREAEDRVEALEQELYRLTHDKRGPRGY
jgi:hypothetical protein